MRPLHLTLIALLGGPATSIAQDVTLPAEFEADRIFVHPVTAAGDTLTFYTDTGGGLFILADAIPEHGLAIDTLAMEGDTLRVVELPELDPDAWIPSPTNTWGPGLPILTPEGDRRVMELGAGMLGQAWFAGRVWTFDYPGRRLILHAEENRPVLEGPHVVPLGFLTDSLGNRPIAFPRIQAVVDADTLDFLFDTGATGSLTDAAAAAIDDGGPPVRATSFITTEVFERWRAAHPEWRVIERADTTVEGMGMIEVPEIRIAGHAVGPVWFTQRPDAAFHEYMAQWMDRPVDGALGGNAFRFFRVTVDYPRALAAFERVE